WADTATLDLLAYLGASVNRLRVLILASFRPDELHPDHPASAGVAKLGRIAQAARIDLGPLAGLELRTFIEEALTGIALPDETRRAIALAGDGNPFFTEELLKSAVEHSSRHAGRSNRSELPATVRATLLERLRPLDEHERRIVTQAAVIGRTFSLDLLATTLGTDAPTLLPALRRARDFQLVEEVRPALFRFRHGLTRDAIYGDFLGAELRPRHRTIAVALEAAPSEERSLEALAYHWWAAGDAEQTLRYNELAGDAAGDVHAHEDAIAFYERAIEPVGIAPFRRGPIVEKIADRRMALTWAEEAQATYDAAAEIFREGGDHEREATCRVSAAIAAYVVGVSPPAASLEAMLARLDASEYLARSRVHLGLAWLAATFWFPTRAAYHLAQVDRRSLAASNDILLRFHNVSAWVAMTFGDLDEFRREHDAWLAAASAQGAARVIAAAHYNGAMCFSFFGLHEEALDHIERALRIARKDRSRHAEESAHAIGALCQVMRGDLAAARREIELVPATTENHVNVTFGMAWGTLVGTYLGDDALIEKWFDGFEAVVQPASEAECGAAYAEILVRRGRDRDATALLHRAIPDCELVRGNVLTFLAVARYGAAADRARAREHLMRAADAKVELVERPALGLFDAIVCRRDGRDDEARTLAATAADGFYRLRFPLLQATAYEISGEDDKALALYRRCGAKYDVQRLELGADQKPHPAPSDAVSSLSAREREIAARAARGQSNLEIAGELAISYKTVEKHLGSVYQKLGVSSRTQLRQYVTAVR
ncbi:MAG TPA: LuxR C-terminal-related transcriptional regulator, partial [Candidatus Elarobacter sp.]|nr:LuxR C-terminal-related transcriptional regulator [Candidatus Elarobacter sp.]